MYHGNIEDTFLSYILIRMCVNKHVDKHFYELKLLLIHNMYSF